MMFVIWCLVGLVCAFAMDQRKGIDPWSYPIAASLGPIMIVIAWFDLTDKGE